MGMIINIDEALKNRSTYNVLKEPLHKLLKDAQEAWERDNPIDMIFERGTLDGFQESYTSTIGFAHAFSETSDYAVGPIFNTAEGFSATYRTKTFQGGFIITQQTLEDGNLTSARDTAVAFTRRWHADQVEYAVKAIEGGFGKEVIWEGGDGKPSRILLTSADTPDGKVTNPVKNPLFYVDHTTVDRGDGTVVVKQSNIFAAIDSDAKPIAIGSSDPGQIAKLADFINLVITEMENYKDDNGKIAGVLGAKEIICGNDARLVAALNAALSMEMFGNTPNPAYKKATVKYSPYFNAIPQFANGAGFIIRDRAYNKENHGPEWTQRIPLTLDAIETKRPNGITYDARERFDINCASWRGMAYCYLGTQSSTATDWNYQNNFKTLTVIDTLVKPVNVVNAAEIGA